MPRNYATNILNDELAFKQFQFGFGWLAVEIASQSLEFLPNRIIFNTKKSSN